MTLNVVVPETMAIDLVKTSANKRKSIDYFEAASSKPNQPLERGAVHLGAARKLGCGGLCMPVKVGAAGAQPFEALVPLEAYTEYAEVALLYAFAGAAGEAELDIISDTDGTGINAELAPTGALTITDARLATFKIKVGQGDKNDMSLEAVTITVTNNAGAALLHVYGLDVQPIALRIVEV